MRHNVALTFYAIKFRVKGTPNADYLTLGDAVARSGVDIWNVTKAYINTLPKLVGAEIDAESVLPDEDDSTEKCFVDSSTIDESLRRISGFLRSGGNAEPADYFKSTTNQFAFRASPEDLRIMPFFFYIEAKDNSRTLLICLQKLGVYGVRGVFLKKLESSLKSMMPDLLVQTKLVYVGQLYVQGWLAEGNLKGIDVTRLSGTGDTGDLSNPTVKTEISMSPVGRGKVFETNVLDRFSRSLMAVDSTGAIKQTAAAVVNELWGMDLITEERILDASIVVDIGGVDRTIPLTNMDSFATRIDITDEIEYDGPMQPKYSSILAKVVDVTDNSLKTNNLID